MKQTDDSTLSNLSESQLVDLKMPLVLRDYQSYFEAASRVGDRMARLREWEISLVVALSILLISQQSVRIISFVPIYLLIALFWILEASERASIRTIAEEIVGKEAKLSVQDIIEFRRNITAWEFGNSIVARRSHRKLYWLAAKSLFHPRIFIWHIGLAISLSAIFYLAL